jgi:tetratricopeptide (TPR) repeat protein
VLRRAAAIATEALDESAALAVLGPLFHDPLRQVRIRAALAALRLPAAHGGFEASFQKALLEARTAGEFLSDSAIGTNWLAEIEAYSGNVARSQTLSRRAIARFPSDTQSYLRLARFEEKAGKTQQAKLHIDAGLLANPASPELQHALGMWHVRNKTFREALPHLQAAFDAAPPKDRRLFGYAYAVTLEESKEWAEALAVLRILKRDYPEADDISRALSLFEARRKTH